MRRLVIRRGPDRSDGCHGDSRRTWRTARRSGTSAAPAIRSARTPRTWSGPILNGLFGRKAGTIEGFNYSEANKSSGITWDEATFREYIKNPKAKIPNTKMVFAGLSDDQDIDDLIAYLKQFGPDGEEEVRVSREAPDLIRGHYPDILALTMSGYGPPEPRPKLRCSR